MSRPKWRYGVVAAVVVLSGPTGCALWGPEGGPGGAGVQAPTGPPEVAVDVVLGSDGVQRVEVIVGDDLRFVPSVVRARAGVIEFAFRNAGVTPHNVRVSGAEGDVDHGTGTLNGDDERTVSVTVDRAGRYPFPCLNHLTSGMQGTLEVV